LSNIQPSAKGASFEKFSTIAVSLPSRSRAAASAPFLAGMARVSAGRVLQAADLCVINAGQPTG